MECKLSTLMGEKRLTIQDVHNATGLSRSTITLLYHNSAKRIDYDTIEKLCNFFQCDLSSLFSLDNKTEAKVEA